MANNKPKHRSLNMFFRHHPEWKGRLDMKTESHSRKFIVLWDDKPVGEVRQFIPVGKIAGMSTCRFQALDVNGRHVGPPEGYGERITAIRSLIP